MHKNKNIDINKNRKKFMVCTIFRLMGRKHFWFQNKCSTYETKSTNSINLFCNYKCMHV